MRLILLFNLPFAVSPHMIVLPGFATLVIVYFENCSKYPRRVLDVIPAAAAAFSLVGEVSRASNAFCFLGVMQGPLSSVKIGNY